MIVLRWGWVRGELAFHPVTRSGDEEGMTEMQQAIEDGACNHVIAAEDVAPAVEGHIARDNDRRPGVQMANQLEEERGPVGIHGQVAQLVDHDEIQASEVLNLAGELAR